ncbi:hypothetical protein HYW74_02590 [Candidatus Pacearchaeota archaeon]|nr:hypothetical protein [Candidatus Pacearchaeota archaeon]
MLKKTIKAESLQEKLRDPVFNEAFDIFVDKYMTHEKARQEEQLKWYSATSNEGIQKSLDFVTKLTKGLSKILLDGFQGRIIHYNKDMNLNISDYGVTSVETLVRIPEWKGFFNQKPVFEQVIKAHLKSPLGKIIIPKEHNLPEEFKGYRVEYPASRATRLPSPLHSRFNILANYNL